MENCDLLISLLDLHNEGSILATAKYNPKKVLFIYENENGKQQQIDKLRDYYNKRFEKIEFLSSSINQLEIKSLDVILKNTIKDKTIINLSSGSKIMTIFLLAISQKYNLEGIYIDIENKKLITIKDFIIDIENDYFLDLNIEDVIENVGGSIVSDSTDINNRDIINILTDMISKNQNIWQKIKSKLYDTNVFTHDECNPAMLNLDFKFLKENEKEVYLHLIDLLKRNNEIEYKNIDDTTIRIRFINPEVKGFIFKTGTWLELFTKKIVEEIEVIDDVKSGVVFFWNDNKRKIKNELDVLAVKDSILICISCKDSAKYDEVALNELNVYAAQLGGDNVIKILATTKPPLKASVLERAKEMNINIVIYDENPIKFKEKIKNIIYGN